MSSIAEFVEALHGDAIALVWVHGSFLLGLRTSAGLVDHRDVPIALTTIFEIRAFASGMGTEWRWVRTPGSDRGRSATVTATSAERDGMDGGYLLWGTAGETHNGWTPLGEARVGTLWVPASIQRGHRARLLTREILRRDEHGNCYVGDEILTGIEGV